MTNAQRRALARMAELNSANTTSMPTSTHSSAFNPHEAGTYYFVNVDTVSKIITQFTREIEPPNYTYTITNINFEQEADTGRWFWFDGKEKLSPRKNQNIWRVGSKVLYDTRVEAETELQRLMAKNGDRVTKVHDLPDDLTHLKKIRSVNHPDRNNPDSDHDLYQAVIEKIDRMRLASA
ncbi:MAG: hypothetical protein PSV17_08565 [Methylotenera sp.]|uniref:hypothetical protein n=1 Tax=Methylotenera sp. TaxID=2051956 RepID=UPI002489BD88|nr:hypothetical protein [Methylotenera sp.]MDI1309470.1 hypothetical protein [Methylotenera sp.]